MFVANEESFSTTATTVVANLDAVLGPKAADLNQTGVDAGHAADARADSRRPRAVRASSAGRAVRSHHGPFGGGGDGRPRRADDAGRRGAEGPRRARRGIQNLQDRARPRAEQQRVAAGARRAAGPEPQGADEHRREQGAQHAGGALANQRQGDRADLRRFAQRDSRVLRARI